MARDLEVRSGRKAFHLRAHLLAEMVDGIEAAAIAGVPEGPAIAGFRALHQGADAMDGTHVRARDQRAIGPDQRGVALAIIDQFGAGAIRPISTSEPKATRGAWRLDTAVSMAAASSVRIEAMRLSAPAM